MKKINILFIGLIQVIGISAGFNMGTIKTPYDKYRTSILWSIIEKNIGLLADNQDIEITTHPDYVIGLLVKSVEDALKKQNK